MRTLIAVWAVVAGIAASHARIITVDDDGPADFSTIQAAIDDANDGDTVEIQPGTYTGAGNRDIDFLGKAITVRSTDPDDWAVVRATAIDCHTQGRGFYFHSGEGPDSIVSGVTITRGWAFTGGAISCNRSSPTIQDNIITGNTAAFDGMEIPGVGGGIYCYRSSPVILNNIITGNFADGGGGGIYVGRSSLLLVNNMITANHARAVEGIFSSSGWGAGISCSGSSLTITNCTILGNQAHDLMYPETVAGQGGAICYDDSSPTLVNSILRSNKPDEIYSYWAHTIEITCSNIKGGWAGQGNIDSDPCFAVPGYWEEYPDPYDPYYYEYVWVEGDYHLKSEAGRWDPISCTWVIDGVTSPCIDRGDPASDWTGELWPHGKRINMGAYGGTPEASMSLSGAGNIADFNKDKTVDYRDVMSFSQEWLKQEVLLAEDLDRNGFVSLKDFAVFGGNWGWQE